MSDAKENGAPGSDAQVEKEPDLHKPAVHALLESYWKRNVRYSLLLLVFWATAGLGCGVLFADSLNEYKLPGTGFPLGFWFAQQGSIICFVLIILVYCLLMNRMDDKHHEQLEELEKADKEDA